MFTNEKLINIQKHLREHSLDGWLIYDFCHMNDLAYDILDLPKEMHLTRRFFYWIPSQGEPIQIVHEIEQHVLDALPGEKRTYIRWQTLEKILEEVLKDATCIAMEVSLRNSVPCLSKVDAGIVQLVEEQGVNVVSSGPFIQFYTCALSGDQLQTHKEASAIIKESVEAAWNLIKEAISKSQQITDYEVKEFISDEIRKKGFILDGGPICAIGKDASNPHFSNHRNKERVIQKGDLVLLDVWCKKRHSDAVFADHTYMAIVDTVVTPKIQEIYDIVHTAQRLAIDFIKTRLESKEVVKGFEVDEVCRHYIKEQGYADFFTHRTGHNIYTKDHGPGAHLDSFETFDDRPLIEATCFSIEPGIYLPGEFGIRLECNAFIGSSGELEITGGLQDKLKTLL